MARVHRSISERLPVERMAYYQAHPVEFVEDFIFHKDWVENGGELFITPQQAILLNSVAKNRRVAVKSGHGIGKSSSLAWLTIWWLSVYGRARVVATAPSLPQLKSVLWPEIAIWLNRSTIKDYFELTATRLYLIENREESFAELRTASKEESLQGIHRENLLLIMDEASGIDDSIHVMLKGAMTNKNNKIVQVGNPIRTSGYFFEAFQKQKGFYGKQSGWDCHTFSSEDSPIVEKDYIEDMADTWGKNHTIYRVRVLGEFPLGDPDSFIPLSDVEAAVIRGYDDSSVDGIPEIGVDVARKGDDLTVIATKIGNRILPLVTKEKTTVPEVAAMTIMEVQKAREITGYDGIIKVKIDDTGVGGGVSDKLDLDRINGIEVIPINFGGAGNAQYENEASWMWGNFKAMLPTLSLPDDKTLKEELSARRWEMSKRERIWIEPKQRFKRDFKRSPDRADAVIMVCADKQNERRVLKNFDPVGEEIVSEPDATGHLYCSLYYSKDMLVSAVWARWNGSILTVVEEFIGSDSDVVSYIRAHGPYKKILGNDIMFSKQKDDLYWQYNKNGIYVSENYCYDQFGAMQYMEKMTKNKTFRVANKCQDTISQLRSWSLVSKNQRSLEQDSGLCYAILNLMSDLKPITAPTQDPLPVPYANDDEIARKKNVNSGFMSI